MDLTCVWTSLMMILPPVGPVDSENKYLVRQNADTSFPESQTPASVTDTKEKRVDEATIWSYDNRNFFEASLEHDPGMWTLLAEGPDYQQEGRRINMASSTSTMHNFTLTLEPEPPPTLDGANQTREVPANIARNLKLGFSVSGGVLMTIGIVLPVVGRVRIDMLKDEERKLIATCQADAGTAEEAQCRVNWADPYRLRDSGLAVLGSGVGLLGGGLTWLIKNPRKLRTALIAETSVGGATLVGGLIALHFAVKPFNERMDTSHAGIEGKMGGHAAAVTLIGFGIGMLTSATIGLGIQHKYVGSLRASALTGPGHAGVLLSGSF